MSKRKWFHVNDPGALTEYGYNVKESEEARYEALHKAVDAYGAGEVVKRLNALANVTENSQPENSKVYRADENWVRQNFE